MGHRVQIKGRINEEGNIVDDNHKILQYTGSHPKIMEEYFKEKEK